MSRSGLTEEPESPRSSWPLSTVEVLGSLVALVTLGIAQPLLDLIGRNAAFLVAHNAGRLDVTLLAIGLPLLLPLGAGALVLGVRRISRPAAGAVHAALVVLLGAVFALVVFRLSGIGGRLPGVVVVVLAVVAGTGLAAAYRASAGLRRLTVGAAFAAPAVAALFVFATPAGALVFPASAADPVAGLDGDPPPIVMVIFDELPLASLLDADRRIDAAAFPSFARLADDATFFRNFTAIHGQTSDVLPAILSGRDPRPDTLPITSHHPRNLFTLLSGTYALHVEEPLTELCPPASCPRADELDGVERYRAFLRDIAIVGSHLVLPEDLAHGLPPIDQGWRDFEAAVAETDKEAVFRDRFRAIRVHHPQQGVDEFVERIHGGDEPTLHFLHLLLPHGAWRYLPDGREYRPDSEQPGLDRGRWVPDSWQAAQGYQRHLLQLQYTDTLLGQLLDRLEAEGLYDDALVVVMADHGASFAAGTSLRVIAAQTLPEIAPVPLLVKAPAQRDADVSDVPLQSMDVLPTILDVLGADVPTDVDGRSAFDETAPARQSRRFLTLTGELTFPARTGTELPVLERKLDLFGRSEVFAFPYGLAPAGTGALLGTAAPPASGTANGGATVQLDDPDAYADVNVSAAVIPSQISGTIHGVAGGEPPVLAVAVNGTIGGVTRADPGEPPTAFRVLVPPQLLRAGANTVAVYLVDADGTLHHLPHP